MIIRALLDAEILQTRGDFLEKMLVCYLSVVITSQTACCLAFLFPLNGNRNFGAWVFLFILCDRDIVRHHHSPTQVYYDHCMLLETVMKVLSDYIALVFAILTILIVGCCLPK